MNDIELCQNICTIIDRLRAPELCPVEYTVVSADLNNQTSGSRMAVEFEVNRKIANANGSLFGGSVSSIVDILTSILLIAEEVKFAREFTNSVSLTLNVEFLSSVQVGDRVYVECVTDRRGKKMVFLGADFYVIDANGNRSPDKAYCGRHLKKIIARYPIKRGSAITNEPSMNKLLTYVENRPKL